MAEALDQAGPSSGSAHAVFGQLVRELDDVADRAFDIDQAFHIGLAQGVERARQQQRNGRQLAHAQHDAGHVEIAEFQARSGRGRIAPLHEQRQRAAGPELGSPGGQRGLRIQSHAHPP